MHIKKSAYSGKPPAFRKIMLVLLSAFFIITLSSDLKAAQSTIYKITLDDDIINPVSSEYIQSAIDKAEAANAAYLIIELDTPGGLLSSTRTIVKKMMNSKVPIAVYVGPKGARAGSAGVFITLAANIAAMAPSTNIGAAHPVQIDEKQKNNSMEEILGRLLNKDKTKKSAKEKPQPMEQKILNDTVAWAETIAKTRNRNVEWAKKAVEESVSVTEYEALKLGIINFIANDQDELVQKLGLNDAVVVDIPKDFRIKWLLTLAHPNIAYILLMLGFYGLLFEFTHPGVAFPGIGGAICLILAFFGMQILPTNYAGIALIILAIGMFIAEIKVVSYGLLTLGGVVSLFMGSLILFSSPYDFMRVSVPIILAFSLSTLLIASFLAYIVIRARRKPTTTGAEGLIGLTGKISSWKSGEGKIYVHGELWNAKSDEELKDGTEVQVTAVNGMTLEVKTVRKCLSV